MSTVMGISYEPADKASQDAWDAFSQSMSVFEIAVFSFDIV